MEKIRVAVIRGQLLSIVDPSDKRVSIARFTLPYTTLQLHELETTLREWGYAVASSWRFTTNPDGASLEADVIPRQ